MFHSPLFNWRLRRSPGCDLVVIVRKDNQMEFLAAQTPDASTSRLQAEMEHFGKDKSLPATLLPTAWGDIWRELVNIGIYRRGPDIAEIGSTWLESMVAMQSLNPFSAHDINQIGGK